MPAETDIGGFWGRGDFRLLKRPISDTIKGPSLTPVWFDLALKDRAWSVYIALHRGRPPCRGGLLGVGPEAARVSALPWAYSFAVIGQAGWGHTRPVVR